MAKTDTSGNEAGTCCVEFRVDPATALQVPSALGWQVPMWVYTDRDYEAGPLGHLYTPSGVLMDRLGSFAPVCAQRLPGGKHVIANYTASVDNLTHASLNTATGPIFSTPPSLSSEVFEVETYYGTANDPSTQLHTVDVTRCIPNPWSEDWADPINQPSFIQRSH